MFDEGLNSTESKGDDSASQAKATDTIQSNRLEQLAPKRALPFASRTSAVMRVSGTSGRDPYEVTVRLPKALETEPVTLALINGLQVSPDKSAGTAYTRWLGVNKFLFWAADHLVGDRLPADIFDQYRTSLNRQGFAQSSVAQGISSVRKAIAAGASNPDFMTKLDDDAQHHVRSVVVHSPRIPPSTGPKRPGMGELFEGLPDDRALFDGLGDLGTWVIAELQSHRDELLQDADVTAALDQALAVVGGDLDALAYKGKKNAPRDQWNPSTLCNAIYEAVCRSSSPTLKERLLLGHSSYRERLFGGESTAATVSIDELNAHLKQYRLQQKTGTRSNEQTLSVTRAELSFAQCDLLSLVKPTDAEHICVQWLLAQHAVQKSGQRRAQLGDYVIQPNSAYLNYTKNRSKTKYKQTETIRKRSPKARVIGRFIALKETHSGHGTTLLGKTDYLAESMSSTAPRWRFLLAATWSQSAIRQSFLKQHSMGQAFLELLAQLRSHGDLYRQYTSKKKVIRRRYKGQLTAAECARALDKLQRESPVISKKTLAPDHIRNTRIALQTPTPGQSDAEERAVAASNGHTADVMKYVYRLRDTSRFGLKERAEFAAAVGEIMTTLSQQIRDAYATTDVLTPEQVADIVGLETGFETDDERADRLFAELDVSGYQLNYFGAHSKGKQRIVVAEPVTVALMLSACETYTTYAQDESQLDNTRAEAILEFALIHELFRQMPQDVVDHGQALFKRKAFPTLTPLREYLPAED